MVRSIVCYVAVNLKHVQFLNGYDSSVKLLRHKSHKNNVYKAQKEKQKMAIFDLPSLQLQ